MHKQDLKLELQLGTHILHRLFAELPLSDRQLQILAALIDYLEATGDMALVKVLLLACNYVLTIVDPSKNWVHVGMLMVHRF